MAAYFHDAQFGICCYSLKNCKDVIMAKSNLTSFESVKIKSVKIESVIFCCCLKLPNSSRKSIKFFFQNDTFESVILESVKIKRGKVDRLCP